MIAVSSYKPVNTNSPVTTVTKLAAQKPKQHSHKHLPRGSSMHKRTSPAVLVGKRLKERSIGTGSKVVRSMSRGKPINDSHKVTKLKQRRRRQPRDHVESLIDGLTDYFTAHAERRLKSPALKSISSYGPESHQAVSSHQLDSPTETSKQLLAGMYSSELSHRQPAKQKKATVEKLFDGLSSFFSVQSEHRRQPTSPVSPVTTVKHEATSADGRTAMTSSPLMNVPSQLADRKAMVANISQLKGLFDGLSHLYTAHGDRKRKSPFFYTAQPSTKSRPPANQQSASTVKQESAGAGPDVPDTTAASQTMKVAKDKQQRMAGRLTTNKSPLLKKSLKLITPAAKKQPPSSGMLL